MPHVFLGRRRLQPGGVDHRGQGKGLHGIAITDHNTCDAITYLLDKGLMRLDGAAVDNFLVIPGVEVTTAEGHLLCIGATLPYLKGKPALEVCEMIHERGGLAIPPHPYDLFRAGIRFATLETLPVDALEVFNAATTLRRYNRYAFKYAQVRGLPMTAASDAHHAAAVGTAYTILNTEDLTVKGVLAQILKSNELNQQYLTPRDSMRKTWNNWLRLRRRNPSRDPGRGQMPRAREYQISRPGRQRSRHSGRAGGELHRDANAVGGAADSGSGRAGRAGEGIGERPSQDLREAGADAQQPGDRREEEDQRVVCAEAHPDQRRAAQSAPVLHPKEDTASDLPTPSILPGPAPAADWLRRPGTGS